MPRPRALPLATLCLCLCLATPGPAAPLPPGDHARTLRHRSQDRSFLLHVPPQAAAGRPLPLVVGLHGGGGSHATFAAKTGFSALADREGFLVAYPDGSGRLFRDRLLTWNAGHCCGYARRSAVDDVGFLEAVLDEVARLGPLDPTRVYFTGHSNGAFMAYRFAAARPARVAAVAAVAGGVGGRAAARTPEIRIPRASTPVPVALLHGRRDTSVLFEGGQTRGIERRRIDLSFEESLRHWLEADGCRGDPVETESDGGSLVRWEFQDCAPGGHVMALVATQGTHAWWGTRGRASRRDGARDLDATALVWDFVSRHRRPPPGGGF